ncbi:jg21358, partial [Pararge aegeria aegeria]
MRTCPEDANLAQSWVTEELADGSFSGSEGYNDMVQIKFNKPVLLK